jgi:hypothetical protein
MTAGRAELERLSPDDVTRYLRSSGWHRAGDLHGRATIWALDTEQVEVIVPVSTRFRDYTQRIKDVIRTVAEAEARPEPEIIRSVTDPYIDRQYFRTFPEAPSGMIPVTDAAEAFQGIRELFVAAAYAEHSRDAQFVLPSRKAKVVEEFPERALVTTGPGSFVIAAHVELPRDEDTLFPLGETFERRTLLRLRQAMFSAQSAAAEAHELAELTPFTERADEGISKTLCRALARFGGAGNDRPFEVRFAWAWSAPTDVSDRPVRFEAEHVTMLRHAAEDLGRRPATEKAEMHGRIQAMRRGDPRESGWVVVHGRLHTSGGTRYRQAWVRLGPDDYERALRAHGQDLGVHVVGLLTRTGRRSEFEPDSYFRVADERSPSRDA